MKKSEVFAFVVKRGKGGAEGVVADSLFLDCSCGFVVDEKGTAIASSELVKIVNRSSHAARFCGIEW